MIQKLIHKNFPLDNKINGIYLSSVTGFHDDEKIKETRKHVRDLFWKSSQFLFSSSEKIFICSFSPLAL